LLEKEALPENATKFVTARFENVGDLDKISQLAAASIQHFVNHND